MCRYGKTIITALALTLLVGCGEVVDVERTDLTGIRLTVRYEASLRLDQIRISATLESDGSQAFAPGLLPDTPGGVLDPGGEETVAILLADDLANETLILRVEGLTEGKLAAVKGARRVVELRQLVPVIVLLGTPPVCGDSEIDALLEGCDDGGNTPGDGCDESCQVEPGFECDGEPSVCDGICGDGLVRGSEGCDDGEDPPAAGDGCDASCQVEPGYTCTDEPSVCEQTCGDGQRDPGEECDDENLDNGDGCSDICEEEPGWVCDEAEPSNCEQTCGNGQRDDGEQCDDDNALNGDGCDANCRVEPGYQCTDDEPSVCDGKCGDGLVRGNESCDDANGTGGDGCSASCRTEDGFACAGEPSVCLTRCGDGKVLGDEQCDDGRTDAADGCNALCELEPGYSCTGEPSVCVPLCGDGLLRGAEGCDDGDGSGGDGCSPLCEEEPGFSCTGEPSVCAGICPDGMIRGHEPCDDDNSDSGDGCGVPCEVEDGFACTGEPSVCHSLCGDGLIRGEEDCDDHNRASRDGCSAACSVEDGYACDGEASVCSAVCGDGKVRGAESCDDEDRDPGDGCSATCQVEDGFICRREPSYCVEVCGDGLIRGAEECDDANMRGGDGCSPGCRFEVGYTCEGEASVCTPVCGDGLVRGDETCDDDAINPPASGDGCSEFCQVERGYSCQDEPSTCTPVCGDGIMAPNSTEQCDDQDLDNGDGCSDTCRIEAGYVCTGEPSVCLATCGNGTIDLGEECDDSDLDNGDGCSDRCQEEEGYHCELEPSVCDGICNDGMVRGSETCDDGGNEAGDGCSANCSVEDGYLCAGEPSQCWVVCGDGKVRGDETCDDENAVGGDGCSTNCLIEPGFSCAGEPTVCTALCGDGLVRGDEACDDGETVGGDGCSATCTIEGGFVCSGEPSRCSPLCGDGVVRGDETCDDGDDLGGDGCSATCRIESGYSCTGEPSNCSAICGDGLVLGDEGCDDGATHGGDGCSPNCAVEAGYACTGQPSDCRVVCGDGLVLGDEECDDGDAAGGDGCSATCKVEPGYECSGEPSTCVAICGDGLVRGGETCDDEGTAPGDGCSDSCQVERGYACFGEPSECAETCGDGVLDPGEACDDENLDGGDGCADNCLIEPGYACGGEPSACSTVCGDGLVRGDEACDDENTEPDDGCSGSCEVEEGYECVDEPSDCTPVCGDGKLRGDEECDDEGLDVGDGCDGECRVEPGYECEGEPSECTLICGNGTLDNDEGCDDSGRDAGDGCSEICEVEDGYECTGEPSDCRPICGDGVLRGSEGCDDAQDPPQNGDGCSDTCQEEGGWVCAGEPSVCAGICGDGLVRGGEGCDDGEDPPVAGDGCSDLCAVEDGYSCVGEASVCGPICGDGKVRGNEGCDDGAKVAGDGCSVVCVEEEGYACTGEPSICDGICGDRMVRGTEQCDDGAQAPGDGCDAGCRLESGWTCRGEPSVCQKCGNGIREGTEGCDDGDTDPGDGCSSACAVEGGWTCQGDTPSVCVKCGNGVVEAGEDCDDGANADGDGCSAGCTIEAGWYCTGSPSACESCSVCDDHLACNGVETCDPKAGCGAGTDLADNTPCDEGAGLSGSFCDSTCQAGECTGAVVIVCDDGLICNGVETCDALDGSCVAGTDAFDGTPCDEGGGAAENNDLCDSTCQGGLCDDTVVADCDNGLLCDGAESCDPFAGCQPGTDALDGTACDEGDGGDDNLCNSACVSGACEAETAPACDDEVFCNGAEGCAPASGCIAGSDPCPGQMCREGDDRCVECLADGDCSNNNLCDGIETCDVNGVCQAGTPPVCDDEQHCNGVETCDALLGCQPGIEPDCSDPFDCTADSCNEVTDSCDNEVNPGFCLVGGLCWAEATRNPANDCEHCEHAADSRTWTYRGDDQACEDGQYCNGADRCGAGTCSVHAGNPCSDGYDCTSDLCNEVSDSCSGNPILAGQCLIAGACYGDLDRNSDNDCEHCNSATSNTTWTYRGDGQACDDGLWCNGSIDRCGAGTCSVPLGAPPCDDGFDCTDDSCDEDGDVCTGSTVQAGKCLIGGTCYVDNDRNGANDCEHCDNATSDSAWTYRGDTAACDDLLFCNGADSCAAGTCSVHAGDPCDDTFACTDDNCDEVGDLCPGSTVQAGKCLIGAICYDDLDRNIANDCEHCVHASDESDWTYRGDGQGCDDGTYCNGADTCAALTCSQHAGDPCNDGHDCTTDICNEGPETCDNPVNAGECLIGGMCYVDLDRNPGNECDHCLHASDDSGWTYRGDGTDCDDGLICNGTDTCLVTCQPGTPPGDDSPCDEGGGAAENGDFCDSSCQSEVCTDGMPAVCDDGQICTGADWCDSASGCVDEPDLPADDYCDGDALVTCDGGGTETGRVTCALGCVVEPAAPDRCAVCGDGAAEGYEVCDPGPPEDLQGETCLSQGYIQGSGVGLTCETDCLGFEYDGCGDEGPNPIDTMDELDAAIAEAYATDGHETITLAPGTLDVSDTIMLDESGGTCSAPPCGLTIRGGGGQATIVANNNDHVFEIHSGGHVIENLHIHDAEDAVLIKAGADSNRISGLLVTTPSGGRRPRDQISVELADGNVIENNRFEVPAGLSPDSAIRLNQSTNTTIRGNVIYGSYKRAIFAKDVPAGQVTRIDHNSIWIPTDEGTPIAYELDSVQSLCFRNNVSYGCGSDSVGLDLKAPVTFASTAECGGVDSQRNVTESFGTQCKPTGGICLTLCNASVPDMCDLSDDPGWTSPLLCLDPASALIDGGLDMGYDLWDDNPALFNPPAPEVGARECGVARVFGGVESFCSCDTWWKPEWGKRRLLTFDNTGQGDDLVDFPVLVKLHETATPNISYPDTQDLGQDLRFVDADNSTLLSHEIELWDEAGDSYVWVRVPQIDGLSGVDTIWMYYDNPSAADGQKRTDVWRNDYRAVYHLGEDQDDSTMYASHASRVGTTNAGGRVGDGQQFNGIDEYLDLGDNLSILRDARGATLETWISATAIPFGRQDLISISVDNGGVPTPNSRAGLATTASDEVWCGGRSRDSEGFQLFQTTTSPISTVTWYHIAATIDYAGDEITIYIDGAFEDSDNVNFGANQTDDTVSTNGALAANDDGANAFFNGVMDEVRVSGQVRSEDWIRAQHKSMIDDAFVGYGGEEPKP